MGKANFYADKIRYAPGIWYEVEYEEYIDRVWLTNIRIYTDKKLFGDFSMEADSQIQLYAKRTMLLEGLKQVRAKK
jgi:hypothetical protein